MGEENGIKGNRGDFGMLPSTSSSNKQGSKSRRKRPTSNSSDDGGAKIIVALLAGAGAAFLLALILLMTRLESEELSNGLLNKNVGGARGVDDQIYLEEASEGHVPMGLNMQQKDRRVKLMEQIHGVKNLSKDKFNRMFNMPPGQPLEKIVVHKGEKIAVHPHHQQVDNDVSKKNAIATDEIHDNDKDKRNEKRAK